MELLTINQVRDIASKALGKLVSVKTVYQWTVKGRKNIRLLYIKAGHSLMIPRRELEIFLTEAFKSSKLIDRTSAQ